MMACATGQLTAAEFEQSVRLFVGWWQAAASSSSQQLCWSLQSVRMPVTGQVISYAQLERIVPAGSSEQQQLPSSAAADALQALQQQQQPELEAVNDEAAVSLTAALNPAATSAAADDEPAAQLPDRVAAVSPQPQQLQRQPLHVHQYSIVHHETYQVPVLYIRASELDGRLLSLSQLLQELPDLQQCREPSQADWTFITQVEHPLLRTPCFMLHPCQTAARMQLLLQQQELSSTQAGAAQGAATPCQEADFQQPTVGSWGGQPAFTAAAATAATAGVSGREGRHSAGGPAAKYDAPVLLLYMRAWFGMLAGLLGIEMLPFFDA
uniref:Ubiquitin-like-conjugating enzyme ATG10 n=1 Tax=Tetradesmus obliquus TaxID=3088 RepID=A0A383VXS2_TETOB|eukprot:jgi/Sobl393_1/13457/SZX70001.1